MVDDFNAGFSVCSIRIFAKTCCYEPTIMVHDIGEMQCVPIHTEHEFCVYSLEKESYINVLIFITTVYKLMPPLQKYHNFSPNVNA